jgi:hypothetical protein
MERKGRCTFSLSMRDAADTIVEAWLPGALLLLRGEKVFGDSVTGVDLRDDLPNFCSLILRRGGHTNDQSLMFGVGGRREKLKSRRIKND